MLQHVKILCGNEYWGGGDFYKQIFLKYTVTRRLTRIRFDGTIHVFRTNEVRISVLRRLP